MASWNWSQVGMIAAGIILAGLVIGIASRIV